MVLALAVREWADINESKVRMSEARVGAKRGLSEIGRERMKRKYNETNMRWPIALTVTSQILLKRIGNAIWR